jgi:hypothetical protein
MLYLDWSFKLIVIYIVFVTYLNCMKYILQLSKNMENNNDSIELQSNSKRARVEVDLANLPIDPCLRKKISDYHINDRDQIQRTYLQKKAF